MNDSNLLSHVLRLSPRDGAFFLYDAAGLRSRARILADAWRSRFGGDLYVSVKANPNPHLLAIVAEHAAGFDVSSLAELEVAALAGKARASCTFSGPAKSDQVFAELFRDPVATVHLDSEEEWKASFGGAPGARTLRLAAGAADHAKFGVDEGTARRIVAGAPEGSIQGFHFYLGRDSFDATLLRELFQRAQRHRNSRPAAFADSFRLHLGAGFTAGVARDPAALAALLAEIETPDCAVNLEAGRAIFGEAAHYVCRVLAVKDGRSRVALVDGGLQHLGRWSSPRTAHEGLTVRAVRNGWLEADPVPTAVFGSLNLSSDLVHPGVPLPGGLRRGDWLVFSHAGAYGLTASPALFIGQPLPGEWLVEENAAKSVAPIRPPTYHGGFPKELG